MPITAQWHGAPMPRQLLHIIAIFGIARASGNDGNKCWRSCYDSAIFAKQTITGVQFPSAAQWLPSLTTLMSLLAGLAGLCDATPSMTPHLPIFPCSHTLSLATHRLSDSFLAPSLL